MDYQSPCLPFAFRQSLAYDSVHESYQRQPVPAGPHQLSSLRHVRLSVCLPNQFCGSVLNGQLCLLEPCRLRWLVFLRLSALCA